KPLDLTPDAEKFQLIADADFRNDHAPPRQDGHKPFPGQLLQGFPDWRPAYVQMFSERAFRQDLAWLKPERYDLLLNFPISFACETGILAVSLKGTLGCNRHLEAVFTMRGRWRRDTKAHSRGVIYQLRASRCNANWLRPQSRECLLAPWKHTFVLEAA